MAARPAALDVSALSPAEFEAYAPWAEHVEATQAATGSKLSEPDLWSLMDRACLPGQLDSSRNGEVLSFFGAPHLLSSAEFLAILRLVAHARTCSTLCRDHVFLQAHPPLRLRDVAVVRTVGLGTAPEVGNPFRRVVSEQTAAPSASSSLSNNPFRRASMHSAPLSAPPSSMAVPPLPPRRPGKPASSSASMPPPPPRSVPSVQHIFLAPVPAPKPIVLPSRAGAASRAPPPTEPAKIEMISSSHPRRATERMSPEMTRQGSASGPPLVAPKPKFVSSTHIGPTLRLRNTPSPAPPFEDVAVGSAMLRRRTHSTTSLSTLDSATLPSGPNGQRTSSSSSGDEDIEEPESAIAQAPVSLSRAHTVTGGGSRAPPLPPPRRRPESFVAPKPTVPRPSGVSGAQRSSSMSASASMTLNAHGRPLDQLLSAQFDAGRGWLRTIKIGGSDRASGADRDPLVSRRSKAGPDDPATEPWIGPEAVEDEGEDGPSSRRESTDAGIGYCQL